MCCRAHQQNNTVHEKRRVSNINQCLKCLYKSKSLTEMEGAVMTIIMSRVASYGVSKHIVSKKSSCWSTITIHHLKSTLYHQDPPSWFITRDPRSTIKVTIHDVRSRFMIMIHLHDPGSNLLIHDPTSWSRIPDPDPPSWPRIQPLDPWSNLLIQDIWSWSTFMTQDPTSWSRIPDPDPPSLLVSCDCAECLINKLLSMVLNPEQHSDSSPHHCIFYFEHKHKSISSLMYRILPHDAHFQELPKHCVCTWTSHCLLLQINE